jgi:SpoVK/Ycf46/Vps4 family AAA+-type ATPase
VSYLIGQMSNRTTIILSGASVGAVGQAGTLARKLAPATIVIEDVDLIGMERGMDGGDHNVMLFQLLNEMDGLQADDDVLFVLTTNRADLLEAALAARPGRIDQALEIGLPSADGRRALFHRRCRQSNRRSGRGVHQRAGAACHAPFSSERRIDLNRAHSDHRRNAHNRHPAASLSPRCASSIGSG